MDPRPPQIKAPTYCSRRIPRPMGSTRRGYCGKARRQEEGSRQAGPGGIAIYKHGGIVTVMVLNKERTIMRVSIFLFTFAVR